MNMHNVDFTVAPRNPPSCAECGEKTRLGISDDCYPGEEKMAGLPMWVCPNCGAFGGCKEGSILPKSRPAGPDTRALRSEAWRAYRVKHDGFVGSSRERARQKSHLFFIVARAAYVPVKDFAFGWLSAEECRRVLAFVATLP